MHFIRKTESAVLYCFRISMNSLIFRCILLLTGWMFSAGLFASGHNLRLIVRLDDCYLSGDPQTEKIIRIFAKHKTPLNVGIIPVNRLTKEQADTLNPIYLNPYVEVFMHGYRHEKYKVDEFTGIPYYGQWEKIMAGKDTLQARNIYPNCFAPPWNGYDENTLIAIANNGFSIISANEFGPKNNLEIKYIPSTCYSVKDAINLMNKGSLYKGIIVLLIHPYSFNSENDFKTLEELLKTARFNKAESLFFSNLNSADENISARRLEYHQYPLLYWFRSQNIIGFNKNIYYDFGSLIFMNILEWILLVGALLYLHLKKIIYHKIYSSVFVGIILFSALVFSYINQYNSYRWILLNKVLVISSIIWLNNRLIQKKQLKEAQAR